MFYLVCRSNKERTALLKHLKEKGILAVFHYLSLHKSPYFAEKYKGTDLLKTDHFADCLVRLPLFYELSFEDQNFIISEIEAFYKFLK
jgi:dTDP-4-amino-4,6-dideoxygalactose transaminase